MLLIEVIEINLLYFFPLARSLSFSLAFNPLFPFFHFPDVPLILSPFLSSLSIPSPFIKPVIAPPPPPLSLSLSLSHNCLYTRQYSDQDGGELQLCRKHLWRRELSVNHRCDVLREGEEEALRWLRLQRGMHRKSRKGRPNLYCEKHDGEEIKLYCKTHGVAVCQLCAMIDHQQPCVRQDIEGAIMDSRAKLIILKEKAKDKLELCRVLEIRFISVGKTPTPIYKLWKMK